MRIVLTTPPMCTDDALPGFMRQGRGLMQGIFGDRGLLSGFRPIKGVQPPYGILALSAALDLLGHQVRVLDGFSHGMKSALHHIDRFGALLVGVSSMTYNWPDTIGFVQGVRKAFPKAFILLGGPHVSALPEQSLAQCPEADAVLTGEADLTLPLLVESLEAGQPDTGIAGLFLQNKKTSAPAGPPPVVRNLDALPWTDRDSLDVVSYRPSPLFYRKLPHTAIMTSRGCPHECSFCCSDRRLRTRSIADVVSEMQWLKNRYGIREVTFYDEALTLDRARAARLCELMLERDLRLSWSANSRVDCVDPPLLRLMKKAGCWRILYGLESGVDKNLGAVAKGATARKGMEAIRMTREAGIESLGTFLFGLPGETFEEGQATIRYATSLKLDYALFLCLAPVPGTPLYKKMVQEDTPLDFAAMTGFQACFDPDGMTRAQQERLVEAAFREFYFRVPYVLRRLGAIRSVGDVVRHVQGLGLMLSTM